MSTNPRRRCLGLAAGGALLSLAGAARAQDAYPNRPIKLVFPLAAGSGGDIIARLVAGAMSPHLGQSVVVENRVGAGGVIGADYVAKAPPDGYTLLLATIGAVLLNPAINPKTPYRPERDFVPIAYLGHTGFVVVTGELPGRPKTFQELLTTVRENTSSFATPGSGTAIHLAAELMLKRAGAKALHIPYKGSAQALTDVASGQVVFAIETPAAAQPLIAQGKLRALAVTGPSRIPSMPDVPLAKDSGLPDYEATAWWGMLAPANTPAGIVRKLSEIAVRAAREPEVRARFTSLGAEAAPLPGPEFGQVIRRDSVQWGDLVKDLGLKAE
jgi:tripartite-type tricarboxylate transporter receptor subunit TctC